MSLLMQALKKAERAKRSHPEQDEADRPSEEFDQALELEPLASAPHNRRATDPVGDLGLPPEAAASALSLEPLDTPPTLDAAAHGQPVPNWNEPQGAADLDDALHSAVPPAATIPPAEVMAPPGAHGGPAALHAVPQPERRANGGGAAPQRSRSGMPPPPPETPRPAAAARPMRMPNPRAMRLYVLLGVLGLIAATFGFIYWRAVYGPGSSKNLPPVPMPGMAGSPAATPAAGVPGGVTGLVIPPGTEPAYGPVPAEGYAAQPPAYPEAQAGYAQPPDTQPGYPQPDPSAQAGYAPPPDAGQAGYAPPPAAGQPGFAPPPQATMPPAAPAVPQPTAEQMQNLTPEDYARMDRQAAAQADAAAAAANSAGVPGQVAAVPAQTPPAPAAAQPAPPSAPLTQAAPGQQQVEVTHRTDDGAVNPQLAAAYAALTRGETGAAREQYEAILQADPRNRDALLGTAAIALREGDGARAAAIYERLLELDPMDADAMAGLVSLRNVDPVQSEARLRRVINRNPEAASPVFALGSLYASEGRWSEAQQQYFKAHAMAPQEPDYAFNLAVSLDRINQPKLALDYYRRAAALASTRTASFDRAALARRIQELGARR